MVRIGAVDYLNAQPLVYGLDASVGIALRFDLPAVCAQLLSEGAIDLGLIPTIAYLDHRAASVVPGVGIISDGPVASVAIFARKPIREVKSLALDTSSRTSAALTRILCARVFEVAPEFVPHGPDLDAMLQACDAALLIGDPALFAAETARSIEKIDLGQTWTDWTGLPFVWAFWAGRRGAIEPATVRQLQAARDAGVADSDACADRYCHDHPARQAVARHYLREHIEYTLSDAALRGLQRFYQEAHALGIVDRTGPIEFFGEV